MAGFLYPKDASQPSNYFVRRWIGWFIKINNTGPTLVLMPRFETNFGENILNVRRYVTFQRTAARWNWCKVTWPNQEFVVIFEQEGPLRRIKCGCSFLRLDGKVAIELCGGDLFSCQCWEHCEQRAHTILNIQIRNIGNHRNLNLDYTVYQKVCSSSSYRQRQRRNMVSQTGYRFAELSSQ
jgi:hypothetical protein